jgi:hypothetical protein
LDVQFAPSAIVTIDVENPLKELCPGIAPAAFLFGVSHSVVGRVPVIRLGIGEITAGPEGMDSEKKFKNDENLRYNNEDDILLRLFCHPIRIGKRCVLISLSAV